LRELPPNPLLLRAAYEPAFNAMKMMTRADKLALTGVVVGWVTVGAVVGWLIYGTYW
jgi:NhaP-type Na+/H+ or K+/H+ antiporter